MRGLFPFLVLWISLPLFAQEWSHVLPADLYKTLDLNQRAQVDKALSLYSKGGEGQKKNQQMFHKNAATEWERFRVQHGDSVDPSIFAYSLFMQAMSQDRARSRHTAVKTFTEVLDFFPDEIWLAAPALYFRAMTHYNIGDKQKGLADDLALLKDEDYRMHPLAGNAYLRVADNHWKNKRTRESLKMWETVRDNFEKKNSGAYRVAVDRLRNWQIVQGDLQGAYDWYLEREYRGSDLDKKINAAVKLHSYTQRGLSREFKTWYFDPIVGGKKGEKQRKELAETFREWFFNQEALFTEAGRDWQFLMLQFEDYQRNNPKELKNFLPRISSYLRKTDPEKRTERAKQLFGKLMGMREYDMALSLLEFYPDPVSRLWATYTVETARKKYESADQVLEQLLGQKDPKVISAARQARAALYHKNMKKYDEAIKLYYEINNPPDTLWQIVDCQRKSGKKDAAQNTLTEIASIFPDQASRAIFAKADYFRQDGEKKMAVGLYRNLLSHPEWKKTGEASRAHDRLEDMGIATGGAVIHEVN